MSDDPATIIEILSSTPCMRCGEPASWIINTGGDDAETLLLCDECAKEQE